MEKAGGSVMVVRLVELWITLTLKLELVVEYVTGITDRDIIYRTDSYN